MSKFPHSQLFVGPALTVVISGPHIQVLDTNLGAILHSTTSFEGVSKDNLLKSGPIRCSAISKSYEYLVTSGDDKILKVWEVSGLKLCSERELPKKPTVIKYTRDAKVILVSDKFGDVFSYPLQLPETTMPEKRDALSSHDNPSGGSLILGHASWLTDFLLTPDEKYIVTSDRDEHIRISWYPQGYNIERYCLGHKKFVSAVHIPAFDTGILVSGGGDPVLKVWDWMTGAVRQEINISDVVQPFINITTQQSNHGDEDDDEDDASENKAIQQEQVANDEGTQSSSSEKRPADIDEDGRKVLVVKKIDSLSSEAGNCIVFTVVGATALFVCAYTAKLHSVRSFNFQSPVVDFTIAHDGTIWILLDVKPGSERTNMVYAWKFMAGEDCVELQDHPLLTSLNLQCLVSATDKEIDALDFYAYISLMPKTVETNYNLLELVQNKEDIKSTKRKSARYKNKAALFVINKIVE